MFWVLLFLLSLSLSFGLDGRQAGERAKSQYNSKEGVKGKLQEPLRRENSTIIGIDGTSHNTPKAFCQSSVEKEILRLTIGENFLEFTWSSRFEGLDRTYRVEGENFCAEGVCGYFDPITGTFRRCHLYRIVGGNLFLESADNLTSCMKGTNQDPAVLTGGFINELLNYYRQLGINAYVSRALTEGDHYRVFATTGENCRETQNPPQTQYMSNPYRLNDYAIYYYATCDETDPSCKAVRKTFGFEDSQRKVCYVDRIVGEGRNVCIDGAKMSPLGYAFEGSKVPMCGKGPQEIDKFSGMFWLECSGGQWILQGTGYWAGYSLDGRYCRSDFYPPPVQITHKVRLENYSEQIGSLYVSSQGENLSGSCVALPVRVSNTNNYLQVYVDGADQCNYFEFPRLEKISDTIEDGCRAYEEQGCRVWNEWFVDANGRKYQVIKEGQAVRAYAGCDDVVWDDKEKSWKAGECPIEITCKLINGRTECRHWWRKEREYKCLKDAPNPTDFEMKGKIETILTTTKEDGGVLSYVECGQNQTVSYCPSSYALRGAKCVASPICSLGGYSSATKRCEASPTCPTGSAFNPNMLRCETSGYCSIGQLNSSTGKCEHQTSSNLSVRIQLQRRLWNRFVPIDEPENQRFEIVHQDSRCSGSITYGSWSTVDYTCNNLQPNEETTLLELRDCYRNCGSCSWQCPYYYRYKKRGLSLEMEMNIWDGLKRATPSLSSESGYTEWKYCETCSKRIGPFHYVWHSHTCPSGRYIGDGRCFLEQEPDACPAGFVYVGGGVCATTQGMCPEGMVVDAIGKVCYKDVECAEGGVFNAELNRCEMQASIVPCSGQSVSKQLGFPPFENNCLAQCVVKRYEGGKPVYDIKECQEGTCPLSAGETQVSACQCNNMSGFGLTVSAMQMLNQALNDWECK